MAEAIGSAIVGKALSTIGKKKAKKNAKLILPNKIDTGNSSYNTKTGEFNIDPSIRAGQDSFLNTAGGLKTSINEGFDKFNSGLGDLQSRAAGLRADYEGNQSAYRESMLNPLRERISTAEGNLDRELGRTGVRGSFKNNEKTNFQLDSGRALGDAEAKVENDRINALGDFIGMDADLLKEGLASDQGRANMLFKLEQSIQGISTERFAQEMAMLGLPASFVGGQTAKAGMISNAEGIGLQASADLAGSLFEGVGDAWGGSDYQSDDDTDYYTGEE